MILKRIKKNYQLTYFWMMVRLVIVYMRSCNLQDKLVKTFKRNSKYVLHNLLSNKENQNNREPFRKYMIVEMEHSIYLFICFFFLSF